MDLAKEFTKQKKTQKQKGFFQYLLTAKLAEGKVGLASKTLTRVKPMNLSKIEVALKKKGDESFVEISRKDLQISSVLSTEISVDYLRFILDKAYIIGFEEGKNENPCYTNDKKIGIEKVRAMTAIERGHRKYESLYPCKRCGGKIKYVSNRFCTNCVNWSRDNK